MLILHHPVDRRDYLRDIDGTAVVGDLDADDASVGSNTNKVGRSWAEWIGARSAASDDASDVSAMTVSVEAIDSRSAALEREIRTVNYVGG